MRDAGRAGQQPTVLIASDREALSRSLESILVPHGCTVLNAHTAAQALERARTAPSDIIILDTMLRDRDTLDLCRELRRDPHLTRSTPIVIVSPDHATRQQRVDALRAGAWDYLGAPLDAEHLVLELETFAHAKLDADRARTEGLLDEGTGLYNARGLARRAHELASQAARVNTALACVVFAPDFGEHENEPTDETMEAAVEQLAAALKAAGRRADSIGRVGPTEFAVVALGTDAAGSVKLAERLAAAVHGGAGPRSRAAARFRLRAGYYVVPDSHLAPVDAAATVLRAATAMRLSRSDPDGSWIRAFPGDAGESSTTV